MKTCLRSPMTVAWASATTPTTARRWAHRGTEPSPGAPHKLSLETQEALAAPSPQSGVFLDIKPLFNLHPGSSRAVLT